MDRSVMHSKSHLFPLCLLWLGSLTLYIPTAHAESLSINKILPTNSASFVYPQIDPSLGEYLHPTEQALASEIANESENRMRRDRLLTIANPSLQPKKCGCIKAHFVINQNLPKFLNQGIFISGKSYESWIRFSASDSDPTHGNISREASKIVIKLINVPGKKLSNDDAFSQDFVLVNHPVNLIRDPRRFLRLMNDTNGVILKKAIIPFVVGVNGTVMSIDTLTTTISNPLQTRYWSVLPFQLGLGPNRQAVKYSVRSCTPEIEKIRTKLTPDYLHDAINKELQQKGSCMEFLIQPRTSNKMDVEDSSKEWKESEAPFYQVATLHIPVQDIEKPEQNTICANLSFTPWHSLPEHRPLGMTNRLRKAIYDHMKNFKPETANTQTNKALS